MKRSLKPVFTAVALSLLAFACDTAPKEENKEQPVEKEVIVEQPEVVEEEQEEEVKKTRRISKDQLLKEVNSIHDDAMAKLGTIKRYERELDKLIENPKVDPMEQEETINKYRNLLNDLKAADQAMMDWMRSFNPNDSARSYNETIEYLQNEKLEITQVQEQINLAIENAKQVIEP